MSAKSRNLPKTRQQRLGEVLYNNHLKAGQADSQTIVWGCDLAVGTTTTALKVNAGEVVLHQAVTALAVSDNQALPAGATTAAGQFRKVLVGKKADNSVVFTVGNVAATQADAVLPVGDVNAIDVGYIEIPASFTQGTTPLTGPMLKPVLYSS